MVYFIQEDGTDGFTKIGYTARDMGARLRSLQTGNGRALHIVARFDFAGPYVEKELHRKLADDRVFGEWFRPSPKLERVLAWAKKHPNVTAQSITNFLTEIETPRMVPRPPRNKRRPVRSIHREARTKSFQRQLADGSLTVRRLDDNVGA